MCTHISKICQYLQNLLKLPFVDPLKFLANRSLNIKGRILIHLRNRPKGKGVDQNPQRNIVVLLFIVLDIQVICSMN